MWYYPFPRHLDIVENPQQTKYSYPQLLTDCMSKSERLCGRQEMFDVMQVERGPHGVVDRSRDEELTAFGLATLEDRYLLPGETPQDMFARVAMTYADDSAHAQRLYDYISRLWFMPATPVLSNGGAHRGLPISCF